MMEDPYTSDDEVILLRPMVKSKKNMMKQCCICYEEYENLVPLECNHEFCENCVNSIINSSLTLKCALCRKPSYNINNDQIDKKIINVELYGYSYIMQESQIKHIIWIIIYYILFQYKHPYIIKNDMTMRSYKIKI